MVQPFRHLAEFHELVEVGNRCVAPPAFDIAHEGRAIDRREDQ
jgi:hypothetical protein